MCLTLSDAKANLGSLQKRTLVNQKRTLGHKKMDFSRRQKRIQFFGKRPLGVEPLYFTAYQEFLLDLKNSIIKARFSRSSGVWSRSTWGSQGLKSSLMVTLKRCSCCRSSSS